MGTFLLPIIIASLVFTVTFQVCLVILTGGACRSPNVTEMDSLRPKIMTPSKRNNVILIMPKSRKNTNPTSFKTKFPS